MTTNAPPSEGPPNAPSGPAIAGERQVPPGTKLIPINFSSESEHQILYDQRVICGWNADKLDKWQKAMAEGTRSFFWIALDPSQYDIPQEPSPPSVTRDDGTVFVPVGHVALDKIDLSEPDVMPDTTLANISEGVLTITSLFVLPKFSRNGLGAFAMSECERLCHVPPFGLDNCVAVTVNTMSPRHCAGGPDGPDNTGIWERTEWKKGPPPNNSVWYERRGFKAYKFGPRYRGLSKDDRELVFEACYLRKDF